MRTTWRRRYPQLGHAAGPLDAGAPAYRRVGLQLAGRLTPISLPAGTVIAMEVVYDNSEANARNPSHPARRVQTGEKSTDEMGNVTFQVIPRGGRGEVKLRIAKYEHLLVQADTARNQYNLANALADDRRVDEAIAHYLRATQLDPALGPADVNLGNLLLAQHDLDGAILHFRAARKAHSARAAGRQGRGNPGARGRAGARPGRRARAIRARRQSP